MGKFRTWIEDAAPQSGAISNSAGQPANPTQSAQQATQIANAVVSDKKNASDVQKITQADFEGRPSVVRKQMTDLGQKGVKMFPKAPTDFKAVTSSIQTALPLQKNTYFKPMKTFMKKETAELEEDNHFVTTPYSILNQEKPKSPSMSLPKRGTTISHMAGQRKKNSMTKPVNLSKSSMNFSY